MGTRKIEKIFSIKPIEKIWNYIKEHTKQGKQPKNKSGNNKNTISFEERKRRILERESALKRQNREIQNTRYCLSPEEIYRMERARVKRSERFNQLNREKNEVKFATQITSIEDKRREMNQSRQQQVNNTIPYNKDFCRMQEAYHKTSSRKPRNESVINYENRKSEITNTKKSTIVEFKRRYAVGSNEYYQYLVNRKSDTKVRSNSKGWNR